MTSSSGMTHLHQMLSFMSSIMATQVGNILFLFFFSVFFFDNLNYDSTYSIDFLKLFNYNPYSAFFFQKGRGGLMIKFLQIVYLIIV